MSLHYPDPLDSARRYLTAKGEYPHQCRLRTPIGTVSPTLYSSHDMSTVNEVFCRSDYRSARDLRVAVDIGSNIGLSALYFLTRNRSSRVYLFEPDPKNVERLRSNLRGYETRLQIEEVAVGISDGEESFAVETTGRYGTLVSPEIEAEQRQGAVIAVRVRRIDAILEEILQREDRIDVLKIDTEGTERELVEAIPRHLLERISTIYYETNEPMPLHEDRYRFHYSCQTNRLMART